MKLFSQWRSGGFCLLSGFISRDFGGICVLNILLEWPRSDEGRRIHRQIRLAWGQPKSGVEIWRSRA